jgi:hypothetical protein
MLRKDVPAVLNELQPVLGQLDFGEIGKQAFERF